MPRGCCGMASLQKVVFFVALSVLVGSSQAGTIRWNTGNVDGENHEGVVLKRSLPENSASNPGALSAMKITSIKPLPTLPPLPPYIKPTEEPTRPPEDISSAALASLGGRRK